MKKQTTFTYLSLILGILMFNFLPPSVNFMPIGMKRTDDSTYVKELRAWHQKRMESLKSESGWLNLSGLFWLKEGQNTFGTDKKNNIVFPKGAAMMGQFTLDKGEVTVEIDPKAEVLVNKKPISLLKVFPSEKNLVMQSGSLRWFIIKRGDKYGIRLRDLESETVTHFKDVETYPIDETWRVKAKLITSAMGKTVDITDVLGNTAPQASPGSLVFKIKDKTYSLDALSEGNELFIIFADDTNGKETYGAGRFLYANKPDATGYVYLDFNKAINPPCAFTPYATCPLPPKQNKLGLSVVVGEKNYGGH
jgi:uncharacterized protein